MEIQPFQLRALLADAAELGANKALVQIGAIKPYMSQSAAFKKYGRGVVERWIKEGLLPRGKKDGIKTTIRIDRVQIEAVAMASNRASWFTHNESKAS